MEKKKNILTPFEFPPVLKELYDNRLNVFLKKERKYPKKIKKMCMKTNVSLKTPRIPFMHWVFCTPLSLLHTAIDTLYHFFLPQKV